jgi:hypothetical protein
MPTAVYSQVAEKVVLDSVVIVATRSGFNVADFIEMVKSDTSFLRGFRNLRYSAHEVKGNMTIYGRKKKITAARFRRAIQHVDEKSRWITIEEEKITGKFYNRREEPGSYTAEIFDNVFFYSDTLIRQTGGAIIKPPADAKNTSNIDKLKQVVFNPGAEVHGVPIIGKRMAIFDEDMVEYYDYAINVDEFRDSISCYVFSCKAKNDAGDKAVVKYLNTWFDRKTFNIVYRDYHLQYYGLLFDFDVTMKIKMDYDKSMLYPSEISYSGFWDVPLRKAETVDFQLNFSLLNKEQ